MSETSGVIQTIKTKQVGSNNKTAYDIQVAGQWYGYGFFKPNAKEGDYVTFTVSQNGNFKNVERGTLKVGKAPKDYSETKTAVKAAVGSYDARQDTISRQAASNTAIAWVNTLLAAGALPAAPKTKGAFQAALDTLRVEYEKKFYEANSGVAWKDISPNPKSNSADPEMEFDDEDGGEEEEAPWT